MSFHRQPAHHVIEAAKGVPATVSRFIGEREIAEVMASADPFGIELHCTNAGGHQPIASCGEIVYAHCARIFWR